MQTAGDIANMVAAARTHLDACGIGPGDVCAVTFGYHMFVAGLFYQTQMEAHGVGCIPLGPGEAERAVEVCAQHNVSVLAGNPSFSLKLIEAGLKPPRVFFAGGEAFTGNPTLYGAVKAAMPDTVLVDSFSLSEFLPVARTFPGGTGVYVFDELVYSEVIDPATGEAVADGERGELVLTHLKKEAQPLVRYRTGDLTIRQTTDPVHGRIVNLPRVVFGRTDDMVKVKGVKVYPSEIRAVLLGLDGLTGAYRLELSPNQSGGDKLVLIIEGAADSAVADEIARRFKSQTLISADDIRFVASLDDGPNVADGRG
jgi:phenylacetate-CoA ligase